MLFLSFRAYIIGLRFKFISLGLYDSFSLVDFVQVLDKGDASSFFV